jgi:hypothetical protein
MQTFLLAKTKESHIIPCNAFHIWKPSAPESAPAGCTILDLTHPGKACLMLSSCSKPHKKFQSSVIYSLTSGPINKFKKYRQMITHAYIISGSHNGHGGSFGGLF